MLGFALLFCSGWAWAGTFVPAGENGVRDQYLVLLAEGVARGPRGHADLPTVADVARSLAAGHGGQVLVVWEHALPGFLMRMPEGRARALARDPRVQAVEQDSYVSAPVGDCYVGGFLQNTRPLPSHAASPQSLICTDPDPQNDTSPGQPLCQDNWGIDRIDAATVGRDQRYHFDDNGTGVHAYVMDVGIDGWHREFVGPDGISSRVGGGVAIRSDGSPSTNPADWFDCTSHGTHVAGILGGRTYGVAKNVSIHPVKIFNCPNGSTTGSQSNAVAGLDWVAANHIPPAVLSWSGGNFGGWESSLIIKAAVENLIDSGVIVVQSAGNQSPSYDPLNPSQLKDACAQAIGGLVDEVILVGGSDENDGRWTRRPGDPRYDLNCVRGGDCGSNAGACIDIWAPAAHVISAYKGTFDQYCRLSGTSMAAPHVAGAVALYLQDHPNASVAEATNALRSRGTWGVLNTNPNHLNWIGPGSDNVLLYSRIASVGPDLPPTARYTWSCPSRRCSFDASTSTDDFGIASYSWNFSDGSPPGSGVTTTHVFPAFAQSRVHLTVTDGLSRTDNYSAIVQAGPDLPPTPSFTFSCSFLTCTFNSSGSTDDAGIVNRSWNFGDGTPTSSLLNPIHTFPAKGSYVVALTVSDGVNAPVSRSRRVSVTDDPIPAAEAYFPVAPCRIYDSRNAPNTILTSDQHRLVDVAGLCGIPSSAKAVSFNVTAVAPTDAGHLVFYPDGALPGPGPTSTINFAPATSTRANNAILRIGANGKLGILPFVLGTPGQVHVLLDVQGYFGETSGGLGFQTVTPCRVADTRVPSPNPLTVGAVRSFAVKGGSCGVPADASAASLNLTMAQPTGGGHVTLFPAGSSVPLVSAINFNGGIGALANGARVNLASGMPDISVQYISPVSGETAHVILDVNGYFHPTAPLKYRPITACRAVDTRSEDQGSPALAYATTRSFQVQGNCGVPVGAKAALLNVTVVGPTAGGHLTLYPSGTPAPGVSTINFDLGERALANGAIVPLSTQGDDLSVFTVTPGGGTHLVVDVFGYFQ